jgi:L-asparaginase II
MNSAIKHIPLVELTRGGMVESVHMGSAVLVDVEGKVIHEWGDVGTNTYLRSSAKPFQALAFLERGGVQNYGLSLKEVAILCSSHTGSADHLLTLQGLQEKIGISEAELQCGVQFPRDQESARQLILSGEKLTANYHNCSGKHSGMLAFAKMIGAPLDNYLDTQHPVQQAILKTFR